MNSNHQASYGRSVATLALGTLLAGPRLVGAAPTLVVSASPEPVQIRLPIPAGLGTKSPGNWRLVEEGTGSSIPVQGVPRVLPDGGAGGDATEWLVTLPPRPGATGDRRFQLEPAPPGAAAPAKFLFRDVSNASLGLWEGENPVFVYHHGVIHKDGVPGDRSRSSYLHPLHGLDGEILTDDFPADHFYHRGLFWAWPHVGIDGKNYDLWIVQGIRQQFERWLGRQATAAAAVLGIENGWYIGDEKVLLERVWLTVHAAIADQRAIDLDCTWTPGSRPVTLTGAEGKSYGGVTLRYAPATQTVITTPLGNGTNDLYMTRLPWADLSAHFRGTDRPAGAAVFIAPDHPDYPPTWLTRHYGLLCVGWPGVQPRTLAPGEPIRCRYRLWVHRGSPSKDKLDAAYRAYAAGLGARWDDAAR